MEKKINLQEAAEKIAKVNNLINEANSVLEELAGHLKEFDDDFRNRSFDMCQQYCALTDEIAVAMMREAADRNG